MRWLLDACVLSDFARGEPGTLARLEAASPSSLAVTVMEVEYGPARSPARARRLAPVMHALLDAIAVLPCSTEDARASAAVHAALEAKGRPIGAYDILIAGLRVESWRAE
ncbi:MAG: PIN domain-containing protein [Burkholderiales bacterium]|nr:PIN domain-containing protein [Burkholderiales bacterium]